MGVVRRDFQPTQRHSLLGGDEVVEHVLSEDAIPHQLLASFDNPGLAVPLRNFPRRVGGRRLGKKRIGVSAFNECGGDEEQKGHGKKGGLKLT